MKAAPLSSRIRNGTLLMLGIALVAGMIALPKVYRLGGAIRTTLYRNYISIEAAQHMHAALDALATCPARWNAQSRCWRPIATSSRIG